LRGGGSKVRAARQTDGLTGSGGGGGSGIEIDEILFGARSGAPVNE